ncbi:hypothetical protein [Streptosporangium canum]|uniref:hypothetical protein n=1 Tax=Streptosporangium canum TaxID=324952 RepID=UPI00116071A9|nr:hypothetical protein [Streptosporangium canum]
MTELSVVPAAFGIAPLGAVDGSRNAGRAGEDSNGARETIVVHLGSDLLTPSCAPGRPYS